MANQRLQVVDALRGFSLAGIVIVHMLENYLGGPPPELGMEGTAPTIIDSIINGLAGFFIRGKFFALFSFLFGLSFYIQMHSAQTKGINFSGRFLWRLLILLGIGYVHHLFYRGDILTIYALTGIVLIPFYQLSKKWLLVIAGILFLGLGRFGIFSLFGGDPIFSNTPMTPGNPAIQLYFDTLKQGSLLDVFAENAVEGHLMKLDFQYGVFGRGYLTFAFFLLGLYFGKIRLFERFADLKKELKKGLIWSIVGLIGSFLIMMGVFAVATDFGKQQPDFNSWVSMIGLTLYDLSNVFFTALIIILFLYGFMKSKMHRFLMRFAPYGRTALTNYVAQTLIGTAILYGWGLGYLGEIPHSIMLGIAVVILIIQITLSKWWLNRFAYGPLEWLWRSLTYFKVFPFKKR